MLLSLWDYIEFNACSKSAIKSLESSIPVDIGGVRTNFRMPDLISIGLGGGSLIISKNDNITVGPESVGYKLGTESLIFGGDKLTASDIAIAKVLAKFGKK